MATAAITGTLTSSATETDVVNGTKTIIITLTGDTWIAAGGEIALDDSTSATQTTLSPSGQPFTVNHTVGSGSNMVLYACLCVDSSAGNESTVAATWNDVSMGSAIASIVGSATTQGLYVFRKINPGAGAGHVDFTWNNIEGANDVVGFVVTYSGVDQVTPNDTPTTETGTTSPITESGIASAVGDLVIDFIMANGQVTLAEGTGQTQLETDGGVNVDTTAGGTASLSYKSGAASVDMSWGVGTSSRHSLICMNLNKA